MLLNIILLFAGFVILIYGADKLVDGGSALAARLNIPNIVIGLTVVAFGTSTPELVVNVISSVQGRSALALGNVLGSNIFNILAILGITAVIYPIGIKKTTTWVEVPMALFASILLFVTFCNDHWPVPASYVISRTEGIIFLCFFLVFVTYTLMLARKGECETIDIKPYSILRALLFIIVGIAGLITGGELLVKGAVSLAEAAGISQRVIAITILSVGTSLPELATSLVAARKKNVDMAIGNVVGSNLFNTFLILGTSAVIRPIPMSCADLTDIFVNILATLLLFLFIFTGKGRRIEKWEGIIFILLYILYLMILLIQ
ncbi:calcium/sodium antiporter [Odoribacter lunatus]|uniref:calcium/sodium antiporter n=1 Tax=Odoribacter lunatus TaxID=2941335 RepID=UPI00203B1724|nr:calcium/sodium antiporter [Odoribacter lunatus]